MKRDGDKVYMSRAEATIKNIYLLEEATKNIDYEKSKPVDISPVYLACIDKILNEIAISLAVIADEITEERKERERKSKEAIDKVLFSSVLPEEERKRMKEEFFESIAKNKEELFESIAKNKEEGEK